ncbi:hypothetical protein [Alienimonas chondri]|uniref:hypothetical protein n=1 Tax=Alienimonas chondri TaxID=2681879 RepID=UPI0019D68A50|nr:hypothetical protein [Alienimonas chondri]
MLNHLWTAVAVLAIFPQLVTLRGLDAGALLVFVAPVLVACIVSMHRPATRGVFLANMFLSLLALGLLIAEEPALFPALGGVDKRLPPRSDRILTWYCGVYLIFVCSVVPIHFFVSCLQKRAAGEPAQLHPVICIAGSMTAAVLGLGMVPVLVEVLGFWPMT